MFVKDCEVQMERGGAESIKCDESKSLTYKAKIKKKNFPPPTLVRN
jgi:hypothetical protein